MEFQIRGNNIRVPVSTGKRTEIANRRRLVAQYILNHVPQYMIADILKVSPGTISGDVTFLNKKWVEAALVDTGTHLARELAELNEMELEAAANYLKYKGNKEKNIPMNSREAARWMDKRIKIKILKIKILHLDIPQGKPDEDIPDEENVHIYIPENNRDPDLTGY